MTPCSEDKCSNPLSYGCDAIIIPPLFKEAVHDLRFRLIARKTKRHKLF